MFPKMSDCSLKTVMYLFLCLSVPQLHCPVVGGGDDDAVSDSQHTDPVTVGLGDKTSSLKKHSHEVITKSCTLDLDVRV